MNDLKPEDLFNFIFIHTFYENQEENYCLDLDANCAISIAFYKWSKGKNEVKIFHFKYYLLFGIYRGRNQTIKLGVRPGVINQ